MVFVWLRPGITTHKLQVHASLEKVRCFLSHPSLSWTEHFDYVKPIAGRVATYSLIVSVVGLLIPQMASQGGYLLTLLGLSVTGAGDTILGLGTLFVILFGMIAVLSRINQMRHAANYWDSVLHARLV